MEPTLFSLAFVFCYCVSMLNMALYIGNNPRGKKDCTEKSVAFCLIGVMMELCWFVSLS